MSHVLGVGHQVRRFSLVGIVNTTVDFVATNLLFFLLKPDSGAGLLLVSICACLIATLNSYLLNSRWTFADVSGDDRSAARFLLTAAVGMIVNTAVFLFLMRHLPMSGVTSDFATLNLARVGGVAAAMTLTFCGYRLWAFAPAFGPGGLSVAAGLDRSGAFPARAVLWLSTLALAIRLLFLAMAPVIYGDAVNYAWVARLTAIGQLDRVDLFWHSLFDFWQALFVRAGAGQYLAPVLASLVPGVLLVWPVASITWRLYGRRAAILAGLLVALHPRLVEYSLNGYAESFYLLGCVWAVWGLMILAEEPRRRDATLAAGLGLSAWILVRNEALLFAGVAVLLALFFRRAGWREIMLATARVAAIVAVAVFVYAWANLNLWGQPGLVEKRSNLAREHIEMLDMRSAARETYGTEVVRAEQDAPGIAATVGKLAARWPANMKYVGERLPGMLLSPVFLFALLLPILGRGLARPGWPRWPLVWMTLWPVAFYPLIQLEPRMLFPTLIGMIVFGSAGAMIAGERLARAMPRRARPARLAPGVLVLLPLLMLIPLLAWHSENERGYHRDVGAWLAASIPAEVRIVGDGYGYVAASSFWAGRRAEPRIWTDRREVLAQSVADDAVLILYERYLREANPELLPALDEGLPGMERMTELRFPRVGRIQVWRHAESGR